ncbi:acyl carrier protein [Undibacterium sp. Jales W-56]|uniref:acyl carrier protein n=1 Tax=Undibacterium sp. Jales W-56 TaxID=2897325 RepID=UPI0021D0CBA9|nr:acyl carrier protein [Undibacterium sp. Jales W-56]MCU6434151.1 acyl carrier protein [Undibacterium sp. Jales W-56]
MHLLEEVKNILSDVLQLGSQKNSLDAESILLGGLAELDSMAVVHVIAALEEHFGIQIDDDEINGKTFETLGSLTSYVNSKLD